ncbi:tryptophan dimethylallyltransferase family protein [Streptomyces fumanus]|uniref:Prenyltransferase n=1 Tax=Streptomyces fumanus TaxID=67302 RepID=A0A919AGC5_9ACTN|nr:tryptophan dimethylallyltransferase family protein [Streptomyces fumanus]GHF01296.1 prenyltransferase [Streptomyces fumanus]
MTAAGPTGDGGPPGAPTLGALTGGQLRRLGAVAGLSDADAGGYAGVLTEALGTVAARPLDLGPPNRTFLSDDHTPVEFSLSFRPGAAPALRVLLEPGCGAGSLARNGRAGLAAVRSLARRWRFGTDSLDAVEDLFLPPVPHGPLALWCALELRPGGVPRVKVYLNPSASGAGRAAATVRRALGRLGHARAAAALPEADGYPFLALDLGDWAEPRVKVYLRHEGLTPGRAGLLAAAAGGPDPAVVEDFFRTAAAGPGAAPGELRLDRRPALTCHAFTGSAAPAGFTLHVPVRDYAGHDGEALARATVLLRRYGIDPSPLPRALSALTGRRPEDGVGLIAYLALAHQRGRAPRVTAYLSCEAYAVRPPEPAAFRPAGALRG